MKEKTIFKTLAGSWMYGLGIEGKSDKDYAGVFLPSVESLILKNGAEQYCTSTGAASSKNGPEAVDQTLYSLHKFLNMAYAGQTIVMDMLASPRECWLESSPEWEFLVTNRKKFFTKNMGAFLGYCKSQAHIYSRKGSRINLVDELITWTKAKMAIRSIKTIGDAILSEPNFLKTMSAKHNKEGTAEINIGLEVDNTRGTIPMLVVCGRKWHYTKILKELLDGLETIRANYGKRAEEVAKGTADNKAVSHAFRVLYECRQIVRTGDLQFPLPETDFIMSVKTGKQEAGYCFDRLERELLEVEAELAASSLPEKVDKAFFDTWLLEVYHRGK